MTEAVAGRRSIAGVNDASLRGQRLIDQLQRVDDALRDRCTGVGVTAEGADAAAQQQTVVTQAAHVAGYRHRDLGRSWRSR